VRQWGWGTPNNYVAAAAAAEDGFGGGAAEGSAIFDSTRVCVCMCV